MRVVIRRGNSSIEAEGDFAEVELILQRFWEVAGGAAEEEENVESSAAVKPPAKPKKTRARPAPRPATQASGGGFDAQDIANKINNDTRHALYRKKVIVAPKDAQNKVRFVSWFTQDIPLTSGDIQRVLNALGIRIALPRVSTILSGPCKQDYLVDRTVTPAKFTLSAPARHTFEQWLLDDGSKD